MTILRTLTLGLAGLALAASAHAAGGGKTPAPPEGGWPFAGPFGQFEQDSVQRGFQVYNEVCSACHGLKLLSYRNLGEKGGPFYNPDYANANDNPLVKAFAAENEVTFINDDGDEDFRPALPSDYFKEPYANAKKAAAQNNGAAPPDLSVITKARAGGASYVYRLMKSYPDQTEAEEVQRLVPLIDPETGEDDSFFVTDLEFTLDDGHGHDGILTQAPNQYYNPYMAGDTSGSWDGDPRHPPYGGFLAMPPQLSEPDGGEGVDCKEVHKKATEALKTAEYPDGAEGEHIILTGPQRETILDDEFYSICTGQVFYKDGTYPSVKQMSYDVAQFLAWAGEPKQVNRKSLGLPVMIYLLILCGLLYASYKQIWRKVDH